MSDKTTELLAKYLDQDFKVFPMAEKPCTASDIGRIEKNFKIKMPKEYSEHICGEFPGLFVEVKEEVWPRPKPYDVGASWTFLFGIHSFTARSESPDWMRLDFVAK